MFVQCVPSCPTVWSQCFIFKSVFEDKVKATGLVWACFSSQNCMHDSDLAAVLHRYTVYELPVDNLDILHNASGFFLFFLNISFSTFCIVYTEYIKRMSNIYITVKQKDALNNS